MQTIQEKMQPRIESLGFQLKMFDEALFDGYEILDKAGVEIPDNFIHPGIDTGFFGVYCEFIAKGNTELTATMPYLRPGMTFMHCKQITKALNSGNQNLLAEYDKIFSNTKLTSSKKISMAELAEMGAPYEHLYDEYFSDQQAKEEWRTVLNKKQPLSDPLAKFNDSERLREVYGRSN